MPEYNIAAMVILALDTVTRRGSLGLFVDGEVIAEPGDASRTHGERLPREIMSWLARHGRTLRDVDHFAIVSGPGSFTGLRVGMACVQGLALAGGKQVIAVPTLEAIASGWLGRPPARRMLVVPCLDGQRGDVFFAAYDTGDPATFDPTRVVIAAKVARPEDAALELASLEPSAPLVIVGDAARSNATVWSQHVPNARVEDLAVPLAGAAVRLAATRLDQAGPPHALRPLYIRRPDAEIARARAAAAARAPTIPPLTIDLATSADDLRAVEALQRQSFTNPWGAESIRWELENTDVARLYVVRGPDKALVAYCAFWMIFDELHINSLAVEVARRRHGVARDLLRRVMRDATAAGARAATLEVRRSNEPALALYEGLGFKVEAVRRDYYQEPREDALVLWHRQLAEATAEPLPASPD
jgi:tRNA threonylcarbamoyl adenosine modification protein YeaZ/ribosomal-protein-alanine acetyltransferase